MAIRILSWSPFKGEFITNDNNNGIVYSTNRRNAFTNITSNTGHDSVTKYIAIIDMEAGLIKKSKNINTNVNAVEVSHVREFAIGIFTVTGDFVDKFEFVNKPMVSIIDCLESVNSLYNPIFIAHNGLNYDFPILYANMKMIKRKTNIYRIHDSLLIYRNKFNANKGCTNIDLYCKHRKNTLYDVHINTLHRALSDVFITAGWLFNINYKFDKSYSFADFIIPHKYKLRFEK